ncbi:MAG TPA: hypothetical protein VH988_30410 [Thermoanaerobaculia bacterium]|jgi:hypothetical protein|nr:hypothetical protein [Thermoanaerobaculia bacterium]
MNTEAEKSNLTVPKVTSAEICPSPEPTKKDAKELGKPVPDQLALRAARAVNWLQIIGWASGIIFLWAGSAFFLSEALSERPNPGAVPPSISDLATIFFGASSLALIAFSLILAIAALIQWQSLKAEVARVVDSARTNLERADRAAEESRERLASLEGKMQSRFNMIENELRGRVDAVMGVAIGTLHVNPTAAKQKDGIEHHIAEVLVYCNRSYKLLKDLGGNGKYMALNNLLYFSSFVDLTAKRDELLTQARQLRDVAEQFEDRPHIAPYFLTFCRVVLIYSSVIHEIEEALAIAKDLSAKRPTQFLGLEATYLMTSLSAKLDRLSGSAR